MVDCGALSRLRFADCETAYENGQRQFLYVEPIGIFYARLYQRGGSNWISLRDQGSIDPKTKLAQLRASSTNPYRSMDVESGSATGRTTREGFT